MSTISINGETRPLDEASADWITGQVNGRRRDGAAVCVQISIRAPGASVALATPGCRGGGGDGRRQPNPREAAMLELWRQHRLNDEDFPVGQLVAFVREVLRLL